jgi:hypothetical protein
MAWQTLGSDTTMILRRSDADVLMLGHLDTRILAQRMWYRYVHDVKGKARVARPGNRSVNGKW